MLKLGNKIKAPKGYISLLTRSPMKAMKDWRHWKKFKKVGYYETPTREEANYVMRLIKDNFNYLPDSHDKWVIPDYTKPFKGDCEDFALACRESMIDLFFVEPRLLLCKQRALNAEAHCVLLFDDWVLDCRLSKACDIKTFRELYTLYAVSSPELLGSWYKVLPLE
jgi:predicted transglutaminase-like cysteine proteinase